MAARTIGCFAILFFPVLVVAEDLTQYREVPTPADSPLRASDEELRHAVDEVRSARPGTPQQFTQWNDTASQGFVANGWSRNSFSQPPQAFAQPMRASSEHVLLRKAFELERIAHELEMHQLFEEAKSVRDTAHTLRSRAQKNESDSAEPVKQSSFNQPATANQELPEPELELLQYTPAAQQPPTAQPRSIVVQQPPRAMRQPPQTAQPRPQTSQQRSRSAPQQSQRKQPNTPSTGQRRPTPEAPPERSLLRPRGWLRNPPPGSYDGRSDRN